MVRRQGASRFAPQLIALDGKDGQPEQLRRRIYDTLGGIGDEKSVAYLVTKASEPGVFGEAALTSIGRIRSADPGARKALVDALETSGANPRPDKAREQILLALGTLKHDAAIPAIAQHLDDRSASVRAASVRSLGRMGPKAQGQVDRIRGMWEGGDESMRRQVALALGQIGGKDAGGRDGEDARGRDPLAEPPAHAADGSHPRAQPGIDDALGGQRDGSSALRRLRPR